METTVDYKRVPLAALELLSREAPPEVALYLDATSETPVLYRAEGAEGHHPHFERLRDSGVASLLVRGEHLGACERLLEVELSSVLAKPDVEPKQKAEYIHHVGAIVARDLAGQVDSTNLERASTLLDEVIDCILSDPGVATGLLQVAAHHCSTASHMFAVSTLGIVLGVEALGCDKETLKSLGLAGMMHDLGKVTIPQGILNKTGMLDHQELQIVQQHPIESVRLIGDDPRFTTEVRQMILQHHERVDGRGYPLGLTGDQILPGSKVLSIVDSFHAMIGQRSYRAPLTAGQAVRTMSYGVGKQFDPEFFAVWEEIIKGSWPDALAEITTARTPSEETDSHGDHYSPRRQPKIQGRSVRHVCNGRLEVECLYAGRLPDATNAPDRFVSAVRDVSRSGVCLYTHSPMYRGEILHLLMKLPTGVTWLRGTVAWCRRHESGSEYRTGIRFAGRITADEAVQRIDLTHMQESETSDNASAA